MNQGTETIDDKMTLREFFVLSKWTFSLLFKIIKSQNYTLPDFQYT